MPMPDADIHPVATGDAKKTVDAHQADQGLIFHSGWFCPFNQRVWMALEEKNIPYKYNEVNPYHKSPEFLKINPKGLVPAIEHDGVAMYESLVLLEYLDEAYPDTKNLFPTDPTQKALVRIQLDYVSKKVIPAVFKLIQAQESSAQADAKKELIESYKELTEKVKGPFFAGEEFGAVDLALAPWFARFYILEENRDFKPSEVSDKFAAWVEACTSRPSLVSTTSDKEHYGPIYGRYLRNEAQSEMAKSTRGEKSHV